MITFKDRLHELREEEGITKTELAKRTDLSESAIGRWESGTRTPTLDCLLALANYFNCSIDYLVGRTNEP